MQTMKSNRYRKPDLMVVVAFSVALGVVFSSVAQAAEAERKLLAPVMALQQFGSGILSGEWFPSIDGINLAERLKNWKPKIEVDRGGAGLRLSHPFGSHGPALRFSTNVPGHIKRSLQAGGDSQVGSLNDNPDAYIFLQRRW